MKTRYAFAWMTLLVVAGSPILAAQDKESRPSPSATEVIPVLVQIVKDKAEDDGVRNAAAQGLIALGKESVPALLEMLEASDHQLRITATAILTNMRPGHAHDAIPALLRVIKDSHEDKDLRRQAALALSQALATAP